MPQPFWEKAYKDLATPAIRGGVPSPEIREIAAQLSPAARVLDLGCGEGRNALFLAERGFKVTAVDISAAGIRKLNTLAEERRLDIRSEVADMRTYRFSDPFDLIVSHGCLHFVERESWQRKYRIICLIAVMLAAIIPVSTASIDARDQDQPDETPWLPVQFLTIKSTTNYDEALGFLHQASERLGIPVDLRDLVYDSRSGLTLPREICEREGFEFPCYIPRGRWDEGEYLSVEWSDAYSSFRPGYYIVVAASAYPDTRDLGALLAKVKRIYPDAYIKEGLVYHGCMY